MDMSEVRDGILIKELMRRGLTGDQFVELLVSAAPAKRYSRAAVVLGLLRDAGDNAFLARNLEGALAEYARIGPPAHHAVSLLFNEAARHCLPQFEGLALRELKEGIFAEGALGYLGFCSSSRETLMTIESLSIPDATGDSRRDAVERIRLRISELPR
jgi:hypothetical protein